MDKKKVVAAVGDEDAVFMLGNHGSHEDVGQPGDEMETDEAGIEHQDDENVICKSDNTDDENVVVGFINKNEEDARIVPMVWPFKERVFLSFHTLLTEKTN
ncbi:hypothetical protein Hdeb2414_s0010g00352231 [Helianthus debilis subsp. tardiflorus]